MSDEDDITYHYDIPLGWELLLYCGPDESTARALFQSTQHEPACKILVIDDMAEFSIWVCDFRFWPHR